MNTRHKKFITEKLIPFILREQGRGFAMEGWVVNLLKGTSVSYDGVERKVPVCGTVACVGGSANVLLAKSIADINIFDDTNAAKALGLSHDEAEGLFYRWGPVEDAEDIYPRWPASFSKRYARAKTALGRARIAADLLKEIARTNGKCLYP